MSDAQLLGCFALKSCYRLAKNELLRLKHTAHSFQQFLVDRFVLPFQVEHRYGHRLSGWTRIWGSYRRVCSILHLTMLAADVGREASEKAARYYGDPFRRPLCGRGQLKRLVNRYMVVTLRDLADPGFLATSPPTCIHTQVQ